MEDTTLFIILVAFLAVGAIGTLVMKSKLSKKGILAPSNFLANALTIVTGFGFLLTTLIILNPILQLEESGSENVIAGLIFGLIFVAGGVSLYFINKKANMSKNEAILLTVFEAIYGILALIIFILKLALSFTGFSLGTKEQAQYTKKQVDDQIVREDSVAPEFATPEQKDEKAREKGYNSYADLEKQANMTVED